MPSRARRYIGRRVISMPSTSIVPASGGMPDAQLLAAVKQRLEDRKLVGTSIVIRPPRYMDIHTLQAICIFLSMP